LVRPPGTVAAVKEIFRANGFSGLYTGFRLHFSTFIWRLILNFVDLRTFLWLMFSP
jgi:hypothetical protein